MLIRLSPNPFISISLSLLLSLSYLSFSFFLFFLFIPFLFQPLSLFSSCALVLSCVRAKNWCSATSFYFPFLRSLSFFRLLSFILSLPLRFACALSVKARNRWRSVKQCKDLWVLIVRVLAAFLAQCRDPIDFLAVPDVAPSSTIPPSAGQGNIQASVICPHFWNTCAVIR